MIFISIPGMSDESIQTEGYTPGDGDWFIADSFSFGVKREMKESGEKGGTEDINMGVGTLDECQVKKSMDSSSMMLAQFAINGNSPGPAEINFVEIAGGEEGKLGRPICYLKYVLNRCYVKQWSSSGEADQRPTEDVAFYYNKIAFCYAGTKDGAVWKPRGVPMEWDNTTQTPFESGLKFDAGSGGWTIPNSRNKKQRSNRVA